LTTCYSFAAAKKHGDEGAKVRSEPLSDMTNRPIPAIPTTYELLDVRTMRDRPGTYQEIDPPPTTEQDQEYLDIDGYDGYLTPIP